MMVNIRNKMVASDHMHLAKPFGLTQKNKENNSFMIRLKKIYNELEIKVEWRLRYNANKKRMNLY